jgi:hypothetical protein
MTDNGHCPDYIDLRPTWKGNLVLLLVAMIVSGGIYAFITASQNYRSGEVMFSGLESGHVDPAADSKRRAIDLSSGLGRNALVFDESDVVHLLRAAVEREGSQVAFADRYGVDRAYVSTVLNGRRRVSGSLAKALGLRKAYVVE